MTTRLDDAIAFCLDSCKSPINDVDFWWRLAGSLRKARDKAVEEAKWQGISSAPRDGSLIVVRGRKQWGDAKWSVFDARWSVPGGCFINEKDGDRIVVADYWKMRDET